MALNPTEYGQYAVTLILIGLYVFNHLKKARENAKEVERLRKVSDQQNVTDQTQTVRQIAADARSAYEMRTEVIEEQSRKIKRLERQAQTAEDERDECREDLAELKGRVKDLEDKR